MSWLLQIERLRSRFKPFRRSRDSAVDPAPEVPPREDFGIHSVFALFVCHSANHQGSRLDRWCCPKSRISRQISWTIRSCNAEAERLLGYRAAELVGQSIKLLIPKERQAEHDEMLARIGRGERVELFETVYLARDRRRLEIALAVSPVHDATGAVIGASNTRRLAADRRRADVAPGYLAAIV